MVEQERQDEAERGLSRRGFVVGSAVAAAGLAAAPAAASTETARTRSAPVGFVLSHEQFPAPRLVEWSARAEHAGFRYAWTSDHFQPWQDNQRHSMHPWLTQALIGARTRRLVHGTGVTCPIYRHHPSEVAQAFASLGVFAPGRVFLGVGTGEALNEKAATGQFGRYPERAARLVEAVRLIRRLWTGERVTFRGTYFRTEQARLYDLPPQPVPIHIAASGPKSAELAGRYGDGWIAAATDFAKPELAAAFARGARAAGRNPAALPRYGETFVVVGGRREAEQAARLWRFTVDPWTPELLYEPNPVRIQQKAAARWTLPQVYSRWTVSEDPAVHRAAIQKLLDAGITPFVHSGQADQDRVIDFYGRHVLPYLRTDPGTRPGRGG
jgi:TAT-translocated FGD2 family F420-dependent dehydrogenase